MTSEAFMKQARCRADPATKARFSRYRENVQKNTGASPKDANTIAFTMLGFECQGMTPKDAFEEMQSRHADKPWMPGGITLKKITDEE